MIWVADVETGGEGCAERGVLLEALKAWDEVRWLQMRGARETAKSSKEVGGDGEVLETKLATKQLAEKLLEDRILTAVGDRSIYLNPLGGCGSGVSGGDAAAVKRLIGAGLRVAVLTVDGHAGVEIERALWEERGVITCSVHDSTGGGGTMSGVEFGTFNAELGSGGGDDSLQSAVAECLDAIESAGGCDVLFLVWGTCGLLEDGVTGMQWSETGLVIASLAVGRAVGRWDADVLMRVGGGRLYEGAGLGTQVIMDTVLTLAHSQIHGAQVKALAAMREGLGGGES